MQRSKLLCQRACKASAPIIASSRPAALHGHGPSQLFAPGNLDAFSVTRVSSAFFSGDSLRIDFIRARVFDSTPRPLSTVHLARAFSFTSKNHDTNVRVTPDLKIRSKPETSRGQVPPEDKVAKLQAKVKDIEQEHREAEQAFRPPEKAEKVAQLNLSARLTAGKTTGKWGGFREVWRLLSIAKGETKILTLAFGFLMVSSVISISIPFSIGKILDLATKSDGGAEILFGFDLTTFYIGLGGLFIVGAGATYGRIITLRVVGERIVTKLRSQLFRQTYAQNAEFFDANRTGDLISRLGSDTIIVGKSITQNLSDGLRSIVSGGAGIAAMAYVSLKLTAVLAIIGPPVAIGSLLYGRVVRNLSRKIQENLGTLTKIAEERLGNVRTSQAFAGEILEVARYNKQTKKIFRLGVREGLYSAAYYGAVSSL